MSGAPRGPAHLQALQAWHRTRVLLMLSAHSEPCLHRVALITPCKTVPASVSGAQWSTTTEFRAARHKLWPPGSCMQCSKAAALTCTARRHAAAHVSPQGPASSPLPSPTRRRGSAGPGRGRGRAAQHGHRAGAGARGPAAAAALCAHARAVRRAAQGGGAGSAQTLSKPGCVRRARGPLVGSCEQARRSGGGLSPVFVACRRPQLCGEALLAPLLFK